MQRSPLALRATSAFFRAALTCLTLILGTGGASAQTVVVHDTFTGTSGSSLTSHVPDTSPSGAVWTYAYGAVPNISSNAVGSNATGTINGSGHESSFYPSGVSDGTVAVSFKPSVTPTAFGLGVRKNAGGYLIVRYNSTGATPTLELMVFNGAWGSYTSTNVPLLDTNWHRIEARLSGSTIIGVLDNTVYFTATNITFNQTATQHGLMWDLERDYGGLFDNFDVTLPGPSISSLSPAAAPIGASVTVTGSGFGATQGTSTVKFNGITATPTAWSATSITAPVPAGTTSGNVVVTVNSVASNGVAFTLNGPPSGAVAWDTFSGADGTALASHALDIAPAGSTWTQWLAGTSASLESGRARATAPGPNVLQPWAVQTNLADATVAVDYFSSNGVNMRGGLALRGIDVNNYIALVAEGTNLVFYRFQAGAYTALGTAASVLVSGSTQRLEARMQGTSLQAYVNGVLALTVTESFQATATRHGVNLHFNDSTIRLDNFSVAPNLPTISSLSSSMGTIGQSITVSGASFGSTASGNSLTFNAIPAASSSWSATSITAPVPPGATSGPVVVTVAGTASNGISFTVCDPVISPPVLSVGNGNGTYNVDVSIAAGCAWTAPLVTSGAIQSPGPTSRVGSGIVQIAMENNTSGPRSYTIPIAGRTYWVYQAGVSGSVCNFTVSSSSLSFTAAGGSQYVTVTPQNGCYWFAAGDRSWIGVSTTATQYTAATITVTVPANPLGVARSGSVAFGTVLVPVQQAAAVSAPVVSSLSPTSGPLGTVVTIAGSNFGASQGTSSVTFNAVTATPTAWTASSITVPVPVGATTGNVVVTVGGVASNGAAFTVTPGISSLSPNSGAVGTSVTIAGTSFGATQGTSTVTFNGVTATPTAWSASSITVPVPTTATSGNVVVTVNSVASSGVAFTVIAAPTISSITPSSAAAGTSVAIAGTNFGASQGSSTVTFNGVPATPTTWSATSIAVPVPASATSGSVVVTVGGAASNGVSFTVKPNISSLTPSSATVGTSVVIAGTTFGSSQGSSTITFNGVTATPTAWSASSITVPVPATATSGNVVVTINGVASNGVAFTVNAVPSISSITPSSAAASTSVTIAGTNFGASQGSSTVTFNGVSATPTTWSATSIAVPVPASATSGNVVVTVGGSASNSVSFTVKPNISSLTPSSATVGTSVVIAGTTFGSSQGSSTVTFNGVTATPTTWGSSSITVPVPATATSGNVVVTVSGVASSGVSFTVAPGISSLSPTSGVVGTSVTISGTTFGATQGSSTVKFNGTTATPASWSNTSITVPVPSGATTGNVVVTVNSVASNGVTFTLTPTLSSRNPTSGVTGTSVTLGGTNFGATQGTSTVTFNGVASTPTAWSNTSITVPVPAAATTGNIVVTVNGLSTSGLSFTVKPAISSLSPSSGAIGSVVTVNGTGFGTTAGTLKFNGTTASPTSWSNTSIVSPVPAGATTGNVIVTAGGNNSTGVTFTVTPGISSLSPTSGAVGTVVTITGTSFGSSQGTSTVTFNGVQATPSAWTATSITVPAPSGATTGNVVVTVAGNASNGVLFSMGPAISSLTPTSGAIGSNVTIAGSGFGATQGTSTVKFNGVTATPSAWSATGITVPVPAGATTGNVVVTVNGTASNGVSFTVAPTISSLSPSSGPIGASVTIAGTNFGSSQGSSTVKFNGTTATVSAWSNGSITASVPTGATTGNVVVTLGSLSSNGLAFTVTPGISSLSSGTGPIGTSITITGTNFGASQGTSTVTFNGVTAAPTAWSATSITAPVPTGATSGPVVVTVGGVASNAPWFGVAPFISSRAPTSGAVGTSVTITGTGFGATQETSTVTFDGAATTPTAWTATSITAPVPAGASTGNILVTVDGVASNGVTFTMNPVLSSVSPSAGAVGSTVTLTGSAFGSTKGTSTVTFNGASATPTTWSATSIVVPVPTSATSGNVVVTVASIATSGVAFTVAPGISSLSPSSGPAGTSVVITGTNFGSSQGTSSVRFNGTTATPTFWASNGTSITASVPAGAATGNVVVTVGGVGSNGSPFVVTSGTSSGNVIHDTFTGTSGSLITSHAPDTGPGSLWTSYYGYVPKLLNGAINSNTTTTFGGSGHESAVIQTGVSDAAVAVSAKPSVAPSIFGLGVRKNAGGYLVVRYNGPGAKLELWQFTGGWSMLASGNAPALDTNYHRIEAQMTGTTIVGRLDGQTIFTATGITFNQTATEHGLFWDLQQDYGTLFDDFDVTVSTPVPAISSVTPAGAPVGANVIITGLNFGATQGTSTVKFNGIPASVSWGSGTLNATVPVGAATGNLVVNVGGVNSNGYPFTVTTPSSGTVYDTFTGANGSALTSHFPDTSPDGAWTSLTGAVPKISSSAVASNAAGPVGGYTFETAVVASGLSDGLVGVDFKPTSAITDAGLIVRATDATHFFVLRYASTVYPMLNLYQYTGTWTLVKSMEAPAITAASWHRLQARLEGTSITGMLDGVPLLTYSSSYNQTAVQHGLYWNLNTDPGATFDTFQVTDLSAAPNVPPDARVFDEFTISGSASMAGRVPTISYAGSPWLLYQGLWPTLNGSKAVPSGTGTPYVITAVNTGTANGTVYADFETTAANKRVGLALRVEDADNLLILQYNGNWSNGRVDLVARVNGVFKNVTGVSVGPLDGPHRLEAWLNGLSVTAVLDGRFLFNVNKNDNMTSTRHGVFWWPATDGGAAIDRFAMNGITPTLPLPAGTVCEAQISRPIILWPDIGGGIQALDLFMPNQGCTWTGKMLGGASTANLIVDGFPRAGNSTVQFYLGNNSSPDANVLYASIAGHLIYLLLPGSTYDSCDYEMTPTRLDFPMGGGTATVNVHIKPAGYQNCTFVVSPDYRVVDGAGWIGISDGSVHNADSNITITVPPNDQLSARTAYLTIGNTKEWVIHQDGESCPAPTVSTQSPTQASASGATYDINVFEAPGCGWEAINSDAGMLEVMMSSDNPTGNGWVRIRVLNNTHSFARFASVTVQKPGIGSVTIAISQAGLNDPGGTISYYHTDPLGSVRMITNQSGSMVSRQDYLPFGQPWDSASGSTVLFTGKERDTETGTSGLTALDYFGARYYSSQTGRFTTTDPVLEQSKAVLDPQRWNRYSYALNNPLKFVDPDGRQIEPLSAAAILGALGIILSSADNANAPTLGAPIYSSPNEGGVIATAAVGTAAEAATAKVFSLARRAWGMLAGKEATEKLATAMDEAVFWSGNEGGEVSARQWAAKNGGTIMNDVGKGLKLRWDPNNPAVVAAFREASEQFARGARGNVRVLQSKAVGRDSVWATVEFPALKNNLRIKSITGIDPETGVETLLFVRD